MPAATSQPGGRVSLRRVCGLLLLKSCQLCSGQRPGLGDRDGLEQPAEARFQPGACWGPHPAHLQGRGLW